MTPRRVDERGSVSIWLALSSFVMVFLVGLAVDLGGQVQAQQRGHDLAAQAARAGGEEIQAGPAIEGRSLAIDAANARVAAEHYLQAAGANGTVQVTGGTTLTVTVHDQYDTKFLGLMGINRLSTTSTATAHLVRTLGGNPR
ncbi:MAG: pilus assembly protein TadG-related protein [Nocardioides sp.]